MAEGTDAASRLRRDVVPPQVPPLQAIPRGGLRGALDRLSPRNANSPQGTPRGTARSADATARSTSSPRATSRSADATARSADAASPPRGKANKIRSPRPPPGAPVGCGAEMPAIAAGQTACGQLGAAEAHELLARAVCEAVRTELREQLREVTCALQGAVRSEVSLALSASPTTGGSQQRSTNKPDEVQGPVSTASVGQQVGLRRSIAKSLTSKETVLDDADSADSIEAIEDERSKNFQKLAESSKHTLTFETDNAALLGRLNYFWMLKEPNRSGRIASFIKSPRTEVAVQMVIMANCIFMALAANYDVANWEGDPHPIVLPVEIVFHLAYTLELAAKLYVHRCFFFWNDDWALNSMDFILVCAGAVDIGFRFGSLWNLTYLRSLRIVKVAKALRLVRVVTGAAQLRNIFICIIGSLMNFVWSIVMLAVVLYIFSLGLVISAGAHLHETCVDSSENDDECADLLSMYGSVQQGMLTLYKATTGGDDWSLSFNAISVTGWVASLVYLFFVAFMHIALVNIITGIFVDTALQKLAPDREAIALRNHTEKELVAEDMRSLWREVSETNDGYLSLADFYRGIRGTKIPYQLEDLGLSVDNVAQFFCVLRNNSPEEGRVRINSFVHGCMRLKGPASSYDLQEIRSEVVAVGRKVDHLVATRGKSASSSPSRCGVEV